MTEIATGIIAAYYQIAGQYTKSINSGIPYFSISLSLNILLTIMIVVRLVLFGRGFRDVVGPLVRPNRMQKAVIGILIESCALYAISSILNIGPWCTNNPVQFAFFPILVQTQVRIMFFQPVLGGHRNFEASSDHHNGQVIAPFLIILRVANQRASANDDIPPVDVDSIQFRTQGESLSGSETLRGNPTSSAGTYQGTHGELSVGTGTTAESHNQGPIKT